MRRFFVVLNLPVVPLGGEGEFVQCGFCRRAFKPSILESSASRGLVSVNANAETPHGSDPALAGAAASTLLVWETDRE